MTQSIGCLIQLNRPLEALKLLHLEADSIKHGQSFPHHPLRIVFRARAEANLGNFENARTWYEYLFRCDFRPRLPAYDPMRVKLEALRFLGEFWERQDREKLALDILRLARSMYQEGRDVAEHDIQRLYQESGI